MGGEQTVEVTLEHQVITFTRVLSATVNDGAVLTVACRSDDGDEQVQLFAPGAWLSARVFSDQRRL